MKKIVTLSSICLLSLLIGCKNSSETSTGQTSTADTSHPVYAYTIDKPDNWETGSKTNTALALKALKAYENNQIDESLSYFADTVQWKADSLDGKFSKDSVKAMFTGVWKNMSSIKVKMHDFESVISKDKKDEYVTLWYLEIFTDKKGKTDSLETINDLKFVNGKIVALDESIRHFPVKK